MTTELFLVAHGTKAFRLPPSAIVGAALSDLALRVRKQEEAEECQSEYRGRHYAFLSRHVRKAKDAAELIRLACDDDTNWTSSTKVSVRIIYGDKTTLREALNIAAGGGSEVEHERRGRAVMPSHYLSFPHRGSTALWLGMRRAEGALRGRFLPQLARRPLPPPGLFLGEG